MKTHKISVLSCAFVQDFLNSSVFKQRRFLSLTSNSSCFCCFFRFVITLKYQLQNTSTENGRRQTIVCASDQKRLSSHKTVQVLQQIAYNVSKTGRFALLEMGLRAKRNVPKANSHREFTMCIWTTFLLNAWMQEHWQNYCRFRSDVAKLDKEFFSVLRPCPILLVQRTGLECSVVRFPCKWVLAVHKFSG